jgi:hypothetical protein
MLLASRRSAVMLPMIEEESHFSQMVSRLFA